VQARNGMQDPRCCVQTVGAGGEGRKDEETVEEMRQGRDAFPNGGQNEGAAPSPADAVDTVVENERVGIRDVQADGKHGEGVEDDDAEGNFPRRDLDCLLSLEVAVLRGGDEDDFPAHE